MAGAKLRNAENVLFIDPRGLKFFKRENRLTEYPGQIKFNFLDITRITMRIK